MSIKDQKSYFICWSLLRTQTEANYRLEGENWEGYILGHNRLKSQKWRRPVPLSFPWPVHIFLAKPDPREVRIVPSNKHSSWEREIFPGIDDMDIWF